MTDPAVIRVRANSGPGVIEVKTGPQGPPGPAGADGVDGADGADGVDGIDAGGRIYKNVLDYGAVGDGSTDDTAAIQAAMDDIVGPVGNDGNGVVFFPAGRYKITSTLDWTRATHTNQALLGEPGTYINGNFADYMITRPFAGTITYLVCHIQGIIFEQSHADGSILEIGDNITTLVTNCHFALQPGCGGIAVNNRCDNASFIDCNFTGGGRGSGCIGLLTGNSLVQACSFVGNGTAMRVMGTPSGTSINNRFEVNDVGVQIGGDFTVWGGNTNEAALGFVLIGGHGESNGKHIYSQNGSDIVISGFKCHSFTDDCTHGIHLFGANRVTIQNCNMGSSLGYDVAGIVMDDDDDTHGATNTTVLNTTGGSWVVNTKVDTTAWVNTDYDAAWTNRYLIGNSGIYGNDIAPVTATIASGAITVTGNYMVIDTEAAAASDDLTTISGSSLSQHGSRLVLRAADSSRTVVVKDGTGNIQCAGDFSLDNVQDTIELIWDGVLSAWFEIGRSDNGA